MGGGLYISFFNWIPFISSCTTHTTDSSSLISSKVDTERDLYIPSHNAGTHCFIFLNVCVVKLPSKYGAALSLGQRSCFLQWAAFSANYNCSKCREEVAKTSSPKSDISTNPLPRTTGQCGRSCVKNVPAGRW